MRSTFVMLLGVCLLYFVDHSYGKEEEETSADNLQTLLRALSASQSDEDDDDVSEEEDDDEDVTRKLQRSNTERELEDTSDTSKRKLRIYRRRFCIRVARRRYCKTFYFTCNQQRLLS